jgi:cytochrome c553
MRGLPTAQRPSAERPRDRRVGHTGRLSLYAAVLVAAVGSFAAAVHTVAGLPPWSNAQSYDAAVGDPVLGRRVAEARCAACHGADGNSVDARYPKLAGQDQRYLSRQLTAFKSGARRSDIMSGIVAALSGADAADAAAFYARQTIRADSVKDKALAVAGERIFFRGAGPGMPPACDMCHGSAGRDGMMMGRMGGMMMGRGMMGSGMMADIPSLYGQHAAYLIDQLNRFAAGLRQGMMMNHVAAALSETDRKAVAEFLASHP